MDTTHFMSSEFDHDRIFYMQVDPLEIMYELPSIFYRTYKDHLKERMLLVDLNDNQIELHLGKGKTFGYILSGLKNLLKFYSLKKGGWLKLMYVGEDVFVLLKVKDNNMCKMIIDHPTGDESIADIL
ncbi:uncharacterized protein DS421_16g536390 [Arachis hypogaea]|nr:uncharacterized protein DS421_16g536390 [Arachis hypogaea]